MQMVRVQPPPNPRTQINIITHVAEMLECMYINHNRGTPDLALILPTLEKCPACPGTVKTF